MTGKQKAAVNVAFSYNPLEETLEVPSKKQSLFIGIPKENSFQENRVALTPQAVAVLVNQGNQVLIEKGAGEASSYSDHEYSEAGAMLVYDKKEVFKAGLILKTAPISKEEIPLLQKDQVIFSPVHIPSLNKRQVEVLMDKKIIAVAIGHIKDDSGSFPIVRSMSQIAGIHAIHIASRYLGNQESGKGILLGGIAGVPPANIVIIGAGMVGEYATRTALGCGANVKVFDNSIYRLMRLQKMVNQNVYTSVIEPSILTKVLSEADVVIGALKPMKGIVPMVVTESMVEGMKEGSVIIDISIDNGGCFETSKLTTHENPVFKLHGVNHYCVPNIASELSHTASHAISNVLLPLIVSCSETAGGPAIIASKSGLISATYIYKGKLTSRSLAKKFDMKYTDLNLILSANP
ncbi:MAG: alanine dehydrogenase [Chitinophagaceae bacterium]|nr:alanine dehydrogenase [Chitinophagaceae bacterium]